MSQSLAGPQSPHLQSWDTLPPSHMVQCTSALRAPFFPLLLPSSQSLLCLIFYHCPHSSHPSTVPPLSSWAWSNLRTVTLSPLPASLFRLFLHCPRCSVRPTLTPYLILQPPHTPLFLLLFFCSTYLHHLPHHLRLCLRVHRGRVWVPPFLFHPGTENLIVRTNLKHSSWCPTDSSLFGVQTKAGPGAGSWGRGSRGPGRSKATQKRPRPASRLMARPASAITGAFLQLLVRGSCRDRQRAAVQY